MGNYSLDAASSASAFNPHFRMFPNNDATRSFERIVNRHAETKVKRASNEATKSSTIFFLVKNPPKSAIHHLLRLNTYISSFSRVRCVEWSPHIAMRWLWTFWWTESVLMFDKRNKRKPTKKNQAFLCIHSQFTVISAIDFVLSRHDDRKAHNTHTHAREHIYFLSLSLSRSLSPGIRWPMYGFTFVWSKRSSWFHSVISLTQYDFDVY